jgi:hypothetical protein
MVQHVVLTCFHTNIGSYGIYYLSESFVILHSESAATDWMHKSPARGLAQYHRVHVFKMSITISMVFGAKVE